MASTIRGGDNWSSQGVMVQAVHSQTGAVATGTTATPLDDTIPQSGEGTQFMTLAITPKSAANKLVIEVVWCGASSSNSYLVVALFQDSTANALATVCEANGGAGNMVAIPLTHEMTAGTTSATTFKVRVGANDGGTITFNGWGSNRMFGGVAASSIRITEISV
jgi:hypothetical protein